ncbi:MAG: tetratricopeptide repeat protein [Candidatus Sumerlaeia bacterium]|nr:tetratricopeptide repeat protein [Candidatus Sumerlaeia bacterium]
MQSKGAIDWVAVAQKVRFALLPTAALLLLFYAGVLVLPVFVRSLAARSLYNYRELSAAAAAEGNYDEAVAVIERAAREIPRDIYFERPEFMYERIGRIRKDQGRLAESLDAFLTAQAHFFRKIELQGYLPPPRLIREIIDAYFEVGNFAGAYHEARSAMDMYPPMKQQFIKAHTLHVMEDPRIMRDLGLLEAKLGQTASAIARLRQSLIRDPRIPESHYWLGRFNEEQGLHEAAIADYRAELANHPFSENAYSRWIAVCETLKQDPAWPVTDRNTMRNRALAQFVNSLDPYEPVVSLFGVGSVYEQSFTLAEPGNVLCSILARSTPCQGLYGWIEFVLDGRHVQTVYMDSRDVVGYDIRLPNVEAGRHTFRIENLSDAMDATGDRNVFIYGVRFYRLP